MSYGIPWLGSKNLYVKKILEALPKGRRLVDLMAGGGAVTHCALTAFKGRWDAVLCNDVDNRPIELIHAVVRGEKPVSWRWLSSEDFPRASFAEKLVWSYNNKTTCYCFGKNREPYKKALWDWIVEGGAPPFEGLPPLKGDTPHERYLDAKKVFRSHDKGRCDLECLESITRLESIEKLTRLESIEKLVSFSCIDYHDFTPLEGDVVYCDPPYEGTCQVQYGKAFDSKDFWEWAHNLPCDVYVSERTIPSYADVIFEYKYHNRLPQISNSYKTEYLVKV